MKNILKKIFAGIGIFLGLTLLFLVGVFSYLKTGQAQNIIKSRYINKSIPGHVTWDSFEFSVLAGRFDFKNLMLKGPDQEKLAAADRVFLNLSWVELLGGSINAEKIQVDAPQVWLNKDKNGRLNILKAFPESTDNKKDQKKEDSPDKSMPFNIVTGEINVTKGFFQYDEPGKTPEEKDKKIVVSEINLKSNNGNFQEKSAHIALNINSGDIDMPGLKTGIGRFGFEAVLENGKIKPVTANLDSDMAVLDISGNIDQVFSGPDMDIDLKLESSLAKIKDILSLEPEFSGDVKIALKGLGKPGNPEAKLAFQYTGGLLAGNRVDNIDLECTLKDRLVFIKALNINSPLARLGLSGEINLQKSFPKGFISQPQDLGALSYNLELNQEGTELGNIPGQKEKLEGILKSNLKIEGRGISLENISAKAVLEVLGDKIAYKDILKSTDTRLLTHAVINNKQVQIEKLDLNTNAVHLDLKGSYNLDSKEILAQLALGISDLAKPFSIPGIKNMSGNLSADADISGSLNQPLAELKIKGAGLGINDIIIGKLGLNAGLDKTGQVSINSLNLDNQGSQLRAHGVIKALKQGFALDPGLESDLSLAFKNIESKDFVPKQIFAGNLNGTLTITGPLKNPRAVLDLQGNDLALETARIGNLNAGLGLAEGILDLKKLSIQNKNSKIFLSGTAKILDQNMKPLKNPEFNLNLDKTTIIASDFSDSFKGELDLSAKIQGSLAAPQASINLTGRNLAAKDKRIGNIEAALRFSEDTLYIEPVKIQNGKSGLDISGTAKIMDTRLLTPLKDPGFNLELKGDKIFLQDFIKTMKGSVALNGHVFGSVSHPEGNISLNGKNIDLGVQKIKGIKLASNLDGEQVNIESFLLAMAPGEEIAADGWVSPVKKIYKLRMKSKGISLKNIDSLKKHNLGNSKISLDLSGKGSFDNPQVNGDLNISGLRLNDSMLKDLKIRVDIKDQVANISGNFNFDLDAQFHLKTKEFSAKLRCDKTDLAPFFKIAGKDNLSGTLTGVIDVRGNADSPEKILASADIKHLSVLMDAKELIKADNFNASFKNREILIPGISLALLDQGDNNRGSLNLSGKGRIDGPLDFKVNGNIPMQVVSAFAQDIQDITGNLKISAAIKGRFDNPDFKADLGLDMIGMSIPGLAQKLSSLNGQVRISPDSVELKDVWGMLDKGRFNLDGKAGLKKFTPQKIYAKLKAHALPIGVPDMLETLLNTELVFSGTADKSSLTGDINILEGRYFKEHKMNLLEKVGKKTRAESAPPSENTQPFLKNLDLNIKIKSRQPFVVDNNLALMTLKPDLRIHGDLNNIKVEGRAEAEQGGIITYQKKDFEVQKGVVDFLNPYKIEPSLDVKSQAKIRKWTIFLSVSGTPDNLVLKLSSEPHEEDADILSLLALGKTTRELVEGEGGASTSTKQMLANIVANTLQDKLKDSTGLDIIEMKYTEGGTSKDDTDDIKVTVGKELSRRMTVKYGVETKDGVTVQQAITEYKFFENLLMKAFQDTEGDFGGELVFRLEFR